MQFVVNGPDIPDELLQAHEDGRVVFFCGAGISYPAGLPGFKGLVDKIYEHLGTTRTSNEDKAYERSQYDAVLDLLERRIPGQRQAVRKSLFATLQPRFRRKKATATHQALLQLARSRSGALRLVTTNFDRIFDKLTFRSKPPVPAHPAPLHPIPKNSRWDGLVYLHGIMPVTDGDTASLNRLVLSSGDFGLAYLTERWAARFVTELFRNFLVCFVGYSINDPVLRYMMDALAADRMLGENTPHAYAFGDTKPGKEKETINEWEAKGVIPILYEVPIGNRNHSLLHDTLQRWGEVYRDGILGKERIVVDYARVLPTESTRQDDFVGRLLWAVSDKSGLPAMRFADADPVPSLKWLDAFSATRYRHADLLRFDVPPHNLADEKLVFSLIQRPASYTHSQWMKLVSDGMMTCRWDAVMFQLARWLTRHLDDPTLILWLAQQGGMVHENLRVLIEQALERYAKLEREEKVEELAIIRSKSPRAIPRPELLTLWTFLLHGHMRSTRRHFELYHWKTRFQQLGLTTALRLELRDALSPRIVLKSASSLWKEFREKDGAAQIRDLIDWEVTLSADDVMQSLRDVTESEPWKAALPDLLDDFQLLLHDALDIQRELGDANEWNDRSHWDLSSVSSHWQNREYRDWVVLIEFLRDAWLRIRDQDRDRATLIARTWFSVPFPTFKRLALFAASHEGCIPPTEWVAWLLQADGWWLWTSETKRECLRLLALQGAQLPPDLRLALEEAIRRGPPRTMFRDDLEPEDFGKIADRDVWLRLAKLESAGVPLGQESINQLRTLTTAHPEWKLAGDQRDEFSHWLTTGRDPGFFESREILHVPQTRRTILTWLKTSPPPKSSFEEDDWREVCRKRLFQSAFALRDLAQEGQWPSHRWREALQVWCDDSLASRSWRIVGSTVASMPADVLQANVHYVSAWLEYVANGMMREIEDFLILCQRILSLTHDENVITDEVLTRAINHPIGRVTQAILHLWFTREPNDNDGLPDELEPLFSRICDTSILQYRYGRVMLASRAIALFRVDRSWTESHLLPRFDWLIDSNEAAAAWSGFLWSPRIFWPLLTALKAPFLETAKRYSELGDSTSQFSSLLLYAALEQQAGFSVEDFQNAFTELPQVGLNEAARELVQALEAAGQQAEDYWTNRIAPFWHGVWPKSLDRRSKEIAESLANLCIAAGKKFPSAVSLLSDWLQPLEYSEIIVQQLHETGLDVEFPADSLRFLGAIIDEQSWMPSTLPECMREISSANANLKSETVYRRLEEYLRKHGT